MNWFLQSHKDKEKYDLLNLEFGNDHTALVIQTFSYIRAIINLVESKQAKVVFVDPFHTWVSDIFHRGNSFDFVKDFLDERFPLQQNRWKDVSKIEIDAEKLILFCGSKKDSLKNKESYYYILM